MSDVVVVTREVTKDQFGREFIIFSSNKNRNTFRIEKERTWEDEEKIDTWSIYRINVIGQGWHVDKYYTQEDAEAVATALVSKRSAM